MIKIDQLKSIRFKTFPKPKPFGLGSIGLSPKQPKPAAKLFKADLDTPQPVGITTPKSADELVQALKTIGQSLVKSPVSDLVNASDNKTYTMVEAVNLVHKLIKKYKFRTSASNLYVYDAKLGIYTLLSPSSIGNGSFSSFVRNSFPDCLTSLSKPVLKTTYDLLCDVDMFSKKLKPVESYLVAMKNGMFNLRTKEVLPFSPKYCFTSRLDFTYVEQAKLPQVVYDFFFNLGDGENGMQQLLAAIGVAISNYRGLQLAPFILGPARNGKSTLADFLFRVLPGGTCIALSLADLGTPFAPGKLEKAHVSIDTDLAKSKWTKGTIAVFKKAVACDMLEVQNKNMPYKTVRPLSFMMFFGNSFPRLSSFDDPGHAIRRRIWPIYTGPSVPLDDINTELPNILFRYRAEILSVALDVAADFIVDPAKISSIEDEDLYMSAEMDQDLLVSTYISMNLSFIDDKECLLPIKEIFHDFCQQTGSDMPFKGFCMRFWHFVEKSRRDKDNNKSCVLGCKFQSKGGDNYDS